jgi:hypothetical protein
MRRRIWEWIVEIDDQIMEVAVVAALAVLLAAVATASLRLVFASL